MSSDTCIYFLNSHRWLLPVAAWKRRSEGWARDFATGERWIHTHYRVRAPETVKDADSVWPQGAGWPKTLFLLCPQPGTTELETMPSNLLESQVLPRDWDFTKESDVANFPLPGRKGDFSLELFFSPTCGLEPARGFGSAHEDPSDNSLDEGRTKSKKHGCLNNFPKQRPPASPPALKLPYYRSLSIPRAFFNSRLVFFFFERGHSKQKRQFWKRNNWFREQL